MNQNPEFPVVQLEIRPSRRAIGRVGGAVHLLVRAVPPAQPVHPDRRPVALALVLDRSGSMAGPAAAAGSPGPNSVGTDSGQPDKLGFVKAATLHLLELVHDGDAVALVTFDDQVKVVKPLTVVDERTRREIGRAVQAIETGGSTFLEGGFRTGLEQFSRQVRDRYGCKLVLLSDGEANVGEKRPAVLAEIAAGAAQKGLTTSTLGVGFDYNIALMNAIAESGNGDFSHISTLDTLHEVLREEFTTAAEVMARSLEVELELPERLAFGSNLHGYRQQSTSAGCRIQLGDLVRPKEFLLEVSTPVPLAGDQVTIKARAGYRNPAGQPLTASAETTIAVCDAAEALNEPVDQEILRKLLIQMPALAEMETVLAYEAGDFDAAGGRVASSRVAMRSMQALYGSAVADEPELRRWDEKLSQLQMGTDARAFPPSQLKMRFSETYRLSRGL
jgi:Ca-activated chloride channel family protein